MDITYELLKDASTNIWSIQEKLNELENVVSTAKRGMAGNNLIQKQFNATDKQVLVDEYKRLKAELVSNFQELP